jgi:hypothetical protein
MVESNWWGEGAEFEEGMTVAHSEGSRGIFEW